MLEFRETGDDGDGGRCGGGGGAAAAAARGGLSLTLTVVFVDHTADDENGGTTAAELFLLIFGLFSPHDERGAVPGAPVSHSHVQLLSAHACLICPCATFGVRSRATVFRCVATSF